jgi:hypothetical protein
MMPPIFLLMGRSPKIPTEMEFFFYEIDPKERSIMGFIFMSMLLGVITFCAFELTNIFLVSFEVKKLLVDWMSDNFWYSMVLILGVGMVINGTGWIIFMIRHRQTKPK